jgi:hypothetical protein
MGAVFFFPPFGTARCCFFLRRTDALVAIK